MMKRGDRIKQLLAWRALEVSTYLLHGVLPLELLSDIEDVHVATTRDFPN